MSGVSRHTWPSDSSVLGDNFHGGSLSLKDRKPGVTNRLVKEIIPRFGFPQSTQSDGGPAFVSKTVHGISQIPEYSEKVIGRDPVTGPN
jgi:hypothetical protein